MQAMAAAASCFTRCVDADERLMGVVTRKRLEELLADPDGHNVRWRNWRSQDPIVAYADEPLRAGGLPHGRNRTYADARGGA